MRALRARKKTCATALYNAATTDACLDILDRAGLREPGAAKPAAAVQLHLDRRAAGAFRVGAVLFSNPARPAGTDRNCRTTAEEWKE